METNMNLNANELQGRIENMKAKAFIEKSQSILDNHGREGQRILKILKEIMLVLNIDEIDDERIFLIRKKLVKFFVLLAIVLTYHFLRYRDDNENLNLLFGADDDQTQNFIKEATSYIFEIALTDGLFKILQKIVFRMLPKNFALYLKNYVNFK